MARYQYASLEVLCFNPRRFGTRDMRAAIEYLKTVPGADDPGQKYIGLVAIAETVLAGEFKLDAKPMLALREILGKKPAEVWEMFDAAVTEQRKGLISRGLGHEPVNWDECL